MKNIHLFKTKEEYENFVLNEAFRAPLITGNQFYRHLIEWVIDQRTPLLFEQTDPIEHDAFSLYWHWILLRKTYTDDLRASMFLLHEFTHSLFHYPHELRSIGKDGFGMACVSAEYASSNETEVMAHYRIPELRGLFLKDQTIWYDYLRESGMDRKPEVEELLKLRQNLIENHSESNANNTPQKYQQVFAMMKDYERLNAIWISNHWPLWSNLPTPPDHSWSSLDITNYESVIEGYTRNGGQAEYEINVLGNMRTMFFLLGMSEQAPSTFEECFEKVKLLEGKVLPSLPYRQ